MIEFYRDRNRRRTKISQVKHVVTKISIAIIREETFVATKEFPIAIEIAKDSKKFCHDKVDKLKGKCLS